jgi:hypothetical protein
MLNKFMLNKGDELAQEHHVLRYIRPRHISDGVINGAGFLRRPQESAASVNWLEYFKDKVVIEQIESVKAAPLDYSPKGLLAKLNVGATKQYIAENSDNPELQFIYDPTKDPTHSLIYNIPEQDTPEAEYVKDLLVHCIVDIYPTIT